MTPLAARPACAQSQAKREELGRVQKELEDTRREIEQYRQLEDSLSRDLQKLESRNAETRRSLSRLQRRIGEAQARRGALKSRLDALGQASGHWRSVAGAELRAYAASCASREDSYGAADLWAEAFARAAIRQKVELIAALEGLGRKTEAAEAETRRKATELLSRSRAAFAEQQSRQRQYRSKTAAIAQAQQKAAAAQQRARELEESARALTSLLRRLGQARRPKPGAASRLDLPKNSLPWPAQGRVIKPFGRERNQELGTWIIHQGILIETLPEASVSALEDGRVIYSGAFRSYGQVVILDHGAGFFSVYGQLGLILKPKGSQVKAGEELAKAGSGQGAGGTLYLEIRRGTEALDPAVWLQRR